MVELVFPEVSAKFWRGAAHHAPASHGPDGWHRGRRPPGGAPGVAPVGGGDLGAPHALVHPLDLLDVEGGDAAADDPEDAGLGRDGDGASEAPIDVEEIVFESCSELGGSVGSQTDSLDEFEGEDDRVLGCLYLLGK